MEINNEIISVIKPLHLEKNSLEINNSLINIIDLSFTEFEFELKLNNCIINELALHTTWFKGGFIIKNCIVKRYLNYEMGGHNEKKVIIKNNIFEDFVNLFDCQFEALLIVESNIFKRGTNLLIDFHTNENNSFAKELQINNNIGELDYTRDLD